MVDVTVVLHLTAGTAAAAASAAAKHQSSSDMQQV